MATKNKRFYWLKLLEDFYRRREIRKIRMLENGANMIVIYQEILLLAMNREGLVIYSEGEIAEELAIEINEPIANVEKTLDALIRYGLAIPSGAGLLFPYALECVDSETKNAEKMRKIRAKKSKNNNVTQESNNVTQESNNVTQEGNNVTQSGNNVPTYRDRYREDIEKDIEIDIEQEQIEKPCSVQNCLDDFDIFEQDFYKCVWRSAGFRPCQARQLLALKLKYGETLFLAAYNAILNGGNEFKKNITAFRQELKQLASGGE